MTEPPIPASGFPADYLPHYSDEEVSRRIVFLAGRCFIYKNAVKARHTTWDIDYDPLVLMNIGQSAMDDIWRYKAYHLADREKRSDAIKRAAYFAKWIVRLRPFYALRENQSADAFTKSLDKNDQTLMLNEGFALFIALNTISTDAGVEKIIALPPKLIGDLLYDLRYRALNEDALTQVFELVRRRAAGDDIILT